MKENIVKDKSYAFALMIIQIFQVLNKEQKEFILSKQLIRSGTAIGALIMESEHAQSKADFVNKLNIALKEANKTVYWLRLLVDSGYLGNESADLLIEDCKELIRLLASIVKTLKESKS
jgi:four helix bundle protein